MSRLICFWWESVTFSSFSEPHSFPPLWRETSCFVLKPGWSNFAHTLKDDDINQCFIDLLFFCYNKQETGINENEMNNDVILFEHWNMLLLLIVFKWDCVDAFSPFCFLSKPFPPARHFLSGPDSDENFLAPAGDDNINNVISKHQFDICNCHEYCLLQICFWFSFQSNREGTNLELI